MKREKKLATAMVSLFIDDEQKKLYDRLHDLELSHKRMKKLLRRTLDYIDSLGWIESDNGDSTSLYESIERELNYPYKRCNWGYTYKQEPGHYCE